MRLIDVDALCERMYHDAFETDSDMQKWDSGCWIRYKMFEIAIAKQPVIEERNKGHWVGIDDYPHDTWECDRCGCVVENDNRIEDWKFCPNCGADMRGEKDE